MSPQTPASGLNIVLFVGLALVAWYLYQIGSRKQERIRYKIRRAVVGLVIYLIAALMLSKQGLPPFEAVVLGVLAGMGCAWLLLKAPKNERRIPTAIRRAAIARDLTSKGLKWDPAKHHIDHVVPFSRGGDHSVRNLRVVETQKNLRKGGKMPGFRDFLGKSDTSSWSGGAPLLGCSRSNRPKMQSRRRSATLASTFPLRRPSYT